MVLVIAFAGFVVSAHAQMMYENGYGPGMTGSYADQQTSSVASTTDSGESGGAALLQQLSSGQASCSALTEDDYAAIGDYAMGLMMGSQHDAIDQYVEQSHGAGFDRSMHIAMGERFSGCNSSASYPQGMYGFGPMMGGGMMGGWGTGFGGYPMIGFGSGMYGYGAFGGVFMALLWIFAIIGVVVTGMWIVRRMRIKN